MSCQQCKSSRVATISAKCSDLFNLTIGEADYNDYVPKGLGIGGGDYVQFAYCLSCGQIQGKFPAKPHKIESEFADE